MKEKPLIRLCTKSNSDISKSGENMSGQLVCHSLQLMEVFIPLYFTNGVEQLSSFRWQPFQCRQKVARSAARSIFVGIYRDEIYSLQILLSRTQAGPGRTVKQEQEEISPNHVQRLNLISVQSDNQYDLL